VSAAAGLSLRDIRASYGQVVALDGVSLDVQPGELMVLLGPSGCGKSTLLAAVAGLQELDAGQVVLDGRDLTRLQPSERNIAVVFQSYALYPTMTVAENLTFGMRMRGVKRAERAVRLDKVVQTLELGPLLGRRPAQLSGGQRQRVAIGRAMVREPALFLFDEPLSNLDAQLRVEMRAEIKRMHQRLGTTMVYVTHDQVEAMTMASRIGVMRAGTILQVGTPRTIYDRPASIFVARFIGAQGMNFIHGHVACRDGAVAFRAGAITLPLDIYVWAERPRDGRSAVLGLRSEDVGIANGEHACAIVATPVLVQPTGSDTLVQLAFADAEITARVHRDHEVIIGEPMTVGLDLRNASLFCAANGMRL
jgi:multiple sugar transport system ATP-binding protein